MQGTTQDRSVRKAGSDAKKTKKDEHSHDDLEIDRDATHQGDALLSPMSRMVKKAFIPEGSRTETEAEDGK